MPKITSQLIPVDPATPILNITLTLSKRECLALQAICRLIGGSPTTSPREIFGQIDNTLQSKGIDITPAEIKRYIEDDSSTRVYFNSYPS